MMRNESESSPRRTSRIAHVVLALSTIGVVLIAAWVVAPILPANYAATVAAVAPPHGPAEPRAVPPPVAAAPVANATTTATAAVEEEPSAPAPVYATASVSPFETAAALSAPPWPTEPPSAIANETSMAPAAPAIDENVPLPRKRPGLTIAARLVIPLPRPRPEMESDASEAELSAFEAQVLRQRE